MILSKRKLKINSKVTYSKIIKMYRPVLQLLVSPTLIGFSNMKLIEKCVVSVLLNSLFFSSTLKKRVYNISDINSYKNHYLTRKEAVQY